MLIGGGAGNEKLVWFYDWESNRWVLGPEMSMGHVYHDCVKFTGLYVNRDVNFSLEAYDRLGYTIQLFRC